MIGVLEPRYVIPSRTHFTSVVMPRLYEQTKSEVANKLRKATSVALTTDGWTSRATESYITITGHYLEDRTLSCKHAHSQRPTPATT